MEENIPLKLGHISLACADLVRYNDTHIYPRTERGWMEGEDPYETTATDYWKANIEPKWCGLIS